MEELIEGLYNVIGYERALTIPCTKAMYFYMAIVTKLIWQGV